MTLRTITFDDSIYKLVPKKSTDEMGRALNAVLYKPRHSNAARLESDCHLIDLAIAAAPAYQEPENLLDTPLPCDIKVGHGTIEKGCKLSTLVRRMNVLYEMAMKNQLGIKLAQATGKDE